ncbi:Fpg/Nei family DNA glycosylase [Gordonia spumicola]|uniref:Fpg/Nei family DNA glycosylase n=1 Tax=Gordonia spumicola TaxID=589161 RepID=UPI00137B0A86|nr:Fpg/Nei family DNA glycosylase [Gordonia spumicola]
MPEGDTVFALARRLGTVLTGATLTRTDFRVPRWALTDLSGGRVTAVRSVGKHLFIDVERPSGTPVSIHSHLKMEGTWDVYRTGTAWRRPGHAARVVLHAGDTEAVGFDLGTLEVLDDPSTAVAHLGPDLLGDDWDPAAAVSNLAAHPDVPIGVALLDQRLLAGVGNIYRSEVCFLRRISPTTRTGDVDLPAVVDTCRTLLWANRARPVRCTTGVMVKGKELWVYGRDRRPCRRCGTAIVRSDLDSRATYTCPTCQP